MAEPLHICLVAGEASGDFLGAQLMCALKARAGRPVRFSGVGGAKMQAEGLQSLFPMEELSVMGIAEILPRLPGLMRRIRQTAGHINSGAPDILITIDAPDFCFRVARRVRARAQRPLMVHYVAPTVWAWRPERAEKIAKLYDGLLCLLPFEPPYFEKAGLKSLFAGHPLMQSGLGEGDASLFRSLHAIPAGAPVLGLFYGSRRGELKRMGPILTQAARRLAARHPDLHIVAPTLPHLADRVKNLVRDLPRHTVTWNPAEKTGAFAVMDAAMATSGTVGLELGIAGVPHIIGYRTNALSAAIVRRMLTTKHVHLANILLVEKGAPAAVPEFIQENCTVDNIFHGIEGLLGDGETRLLQKQAFAAVRVLLGGSDQADASARAAAFILSLKKN